MAELLTPIPGQRYRHNKTGHIYTVLHVGIYCGWWEYPPKSDGSVSAASQGFEEGKELVVYVGHYDNPRGNRVYIRPVTEWAETVSACVGSVGIDMPRYEHIV